MKVKHALKVQVAIAAGFAGFVMVILATAAQVKETGIPHWNFVVDGFIRSGGGFIAVISLLVLLLRVIGGASVEDGSPLVLPLVGGIALLYQHWAPVLTLGLALVAVLATQGLRLSRRASQPSGEGQPHHPGAPLPPP